MQSKNLNQQKILVSTMYRFLETLQVKQFTKKDLEQFYTANAKMIINDQLVARDINEFFEHFKLMAEKPCKYSLIFAENPMISEDKRLSIQYKIEMYGQQKIIMYSMVFFTFNDDKICLWNQLVSTVSATEMQLTRQ